MKKLISLLILFICFTGLVSCSENDKYTYERFYGVVKFLDESNQLVVYIPNVGNVVIPESDSCCSFFDDNKNENYQLKEGDFIIIHFKFEKSWDNHNIEIMEIYPARFSKKAYLIEALKENISFYKTEDKYLLSFPVTTEIESADIGDTLYFVYHSGENGCAYAKLNAEGEIVGLNDGIITVSLSMLDNEYDFFKYFNKMTIEVTWNE